MCTAPAKVTNVHADIRLIAACTGEHGRENYVNRAVSMSLRAECARSADMK